MFYGFSLSLFPLFTDSLTRLDVVRPDRVCHRHCRSPMGVSHGRRPFVYFALVSLSLSWPVVNFNLNVEVVSATQVGLLDDVTVAVVVLSPLHIRMQLDPNRSIPPNDVSWCSSWGHI